MLQLRFRTTVYGESVYKLSIENYSIGITTVSPCCSVLYFINEIDGRPINVPPDFTMVANTSQLSTLVTPFANRVFAMSHTVIHMLAYKNKKTVLTICPQSFNSAYYYSSQFSSASNVVRKIEPSCSSASVSLASSEEVSRGSERKTHSSENMMYDYIIEEWGDCVALREEIEQVGYDKFYYDNGLGNLLRIQRKTFDEFYEDCDCWCGRCEVQPIVTETK